MTEERKKELFPYFAYKESQKLDPDKYGNASIEEWQSLIQESPEDIEKIVQAAEQMSEEGWDDIEEEYKEQTESAVQFAAKGAKLKKLKSMKKSKKCKCGCDMVSVKAAGGKMIDRCACGCGVKKHEKGGEFNSVEGIKEREKQSKFPRAILRSKRKVEPMITARQNEDKAFKRNSEMWKKRGNFNPSLDRGKAEASRREKNKIDAETKNRVVLKNQKGNTIKAKKPTPQKHDKGGGDETWVDSNIGTGNNSMNPKDWDKNKTKPIIKKPVTKKPLPIKKESGGLVNKIKIDKCGGKAKAPDRIKKAKLKK